ncbi:MAG TPA: hypothetical protein VMT34_11930, partial [Aggregatilineales bacterium]|nr:hypothetical protein [Aggregatilineales bacterium]
LRFLYFVAAVVAWVAVISGLIWFRLYTVDSALRDSLIQTAQAETAALRIGDAGVYMAFQRSASQEWISAQAERFKRYQALKAKSDVQLTGHVLDATVDGSRGRVILEEVIDSQSYRVVWYYWRYPDGWHHVPSDYTFWGDDVTITSKNVVIKYKTLDSDLARLLADRADAWWRSGCTSFGCDKLTPLGVLTITITPDQTTQIRWEDSAKNDTLIVPSPLASEEDRVKNDPSAGTTLADIAHQLAMRLFDHASGNLHVAAFSDASWLRESAINWLAAQFAGSTDTTRLNLIQTLHDRYGDSGLGALITSLTTNADIRILGDALRLPLDQVQVDWKPFFQWRLDLEKLILTSNTSDKQTIFFALWLTDPASLDRARQRFSRPDQATPQVTAAAITPAGDGTVVATVQVTGTAPPLKFVLASGTWKRSA